MQCIDVLNVIYELLVLLLISFSVVSFVVVSTAYKALASSKVLHVL